MFEHAKISMDDLALESFDFHVEKYDRQFLGKNRKLVLGVFRLVYTCNTDTGIKKLTIPRATITLLDSVDSISIEGRCPTFMIDDESIEDHFFTVDLFGTRIKLKYDEEAKAAFVIEDIPKPKKMTVEEIEKALGYKVEIISNE